MPGPLWRYGLPLVTLMGFGLLMYWHSTMLVGYAGEPSLDMRWQGYNLADVETYLANLGDAGRAFYLGPVRVLDSFVPLLLMLTLLLPLRMAGKLMHWLALPAILAALTDLGENFAVARILRQAVGTTLPSETLTAWASSLTMTKFALFALATLIALGALIAGRKA